MSKYKCYDWEGSLIISKINNLREAVEHALKNKCEVHDENGDSIFSSWDGWNSDYPNIEKICFPVADINMIDKARQFLEDTGLFYEWNKFISNQFFTWIGKGEWLHSDRWSATYDWINSKEIEVPEGIIECLVEYWETNALHIKVGI